MSSAPYLVTKLLKPFVKNLRSEGKSVVVFLDEGAARSYDLARIASLQIHADLLIFGLCPDEEMCLWLPVQTIVLLGTVIYSADFPVAASEKRIKKLYQDLVDVLSSLIYYIVN